MPCVSFGGADFEGFRIYGGEKKDYCLNNLKSGGLLRPGNCCKESN